MFIGHYAAALAGKRAAPGVSLGWLILAAQLLDLIWPLFVLLGIERVEIDPGNTRFTPLDFVYYPWTHSLLAASLWAALLVLIYALLRRDLRGAILLGFLVVSHWLLDFLVHRPDLPLIPHQEPRLGLGLWNNVAATVIVETLIFAGGIWLYVRMTRSSNRRGSVAFWSLILFLAVIYIANIAAPPPPSDQAVAWAALSLWLLPLWGWWADRNRSLRER